ncbi:MAG: hypothetical protein IJ659_09485 [Alloprevotella sp.]|nr:hypothetical protein [Alloprevotella sp.]MBR1594986.1 hypothetical protein [Alloprevotella sp.]
MNKNIFGTALLLLCTTLFAGSCAGSDDNTYETSGSCIITAVQLGSLVRTLHTTAADGSDSTYTVTVQGTDYPLTIDQLRGTICNLDSLPVGTDVSRTVLATLTASGSVSIKSLATGEDTLFVASDSTDFSQTRFVTAYATDGVSRRTYAVELRVHREWADSTTWTLGGRHEALETLSAGSGCVEDGVLHAFARLAQGPAHLTTPALSPGSGWSVQAVGNGNLDVRSVRRMGSKWYALAAGQLVASDNGSDWSSEGLQATSYTALAAAATASGILVATDGENFFSSTDGGASWTQDERESGALPQAGISGTVLTSEADPTLERAYVIGTRDGQTELWCRTLDSTGRSSQPWMHITTSRDADKACPLLDNYTLLPYDGGLLLLGEAAGDLSVPVVSYDGGRTWQRNVLKRPAAASAKAVCAAAGTGGQVYLLLGGEGQLWYGHVNRLGWRDIPTAFRK